MQDIQNLNQLTICKRTFVTQNNTHLSIKNLIAERDSCCRSHVLSNAFYRPNAENFITWAVDLQSGSPTKS